MRIVILALLFSFAFTLFIPLMPRRPRCMIVYSVGESESIKIEANFASLPNQGVGQKYDISLKNTQTNDIKTESLLNGIYKREFDLSSNVIYQFCIELITDRQLENIMVSYKAETMYSLSHENYKIPDSLLKKQDFKATYEASYRINSVVQAYKDMQHERNQKDSTNFDKTTEVQNMLILVSWIEIVVVVVAGIYEYWCLQKYLTSKQYI